MFKVSPASLHTLTRRTVFLKTVFSIARSTFRAYSVMAIFKSSVVWGLFEYTEFFIAPQRKKIGRRKIRRSWRTNGFRNDSVSKHVVQECHRHMRCMSRSAILLKVGLSIAGRRDTQYCHSTVGSWESPRKKKMGRLCAYATFQTKHQSSHYAAATRGTHANCVHIRHVRFDCWCTPTNGSMPRLWGVWHPKYPLLHGQESLKTTCSTLPA